MQRHYQASPSMKTVKESLSAWPLPSQGRNGRVCVGDVCFWPLADMSLCAAHVRFFGGASASPTAADASLAFEGFVNSEVRC